MTSNDKTLYRTVYCQRTTDTKEQIEDSSEDETEADESYNRVPCPYCCKFFKGINGLKSCDAFKNLK